MAEEARTLPHRVTIDERERLTLTGATEVLRFDEEVAQLATSQGDLVVQGQELKLKTLSLDGGTVSITGKIDAVYYVESRPRRGLGKLFG